MPFYVLVTILAYLCWGLFPLYFHAVSEVGALEILSHRLVWSLLFVVLLLGVLRRWVWLKGALRSPKILLVFLCSSALVGTNWGTYVYSIVTDRTIEASLGYFVNPLMSIALGAVFLRERMRPLQNVSVALAAAGVAWIAWRSGSTPWLGLTLAATFAVYGLIRKIAPLGSLEGMALETLILAPFAMIYMLWLHCDGAFFFETAPVDYKLLLAAAGPISTIPLLLFAAGVRHIPYSTVGFIQYLSPSLVFLIGLYVFHEPFSADQFTGFLIIWSAVALFTVESVVHTRSVRRRTNSAAAGSRR